jgi:hypothetical protein
MKKIISLVLALLIPLLGCATPSYLSEGSSSTYLQAIEEGEWVELASPRGSPDSARQILEEAVDTGRDHLRVFTSDGDTVVIKDPTIREQIIFSDVVEGQVVIGENIALEDVIRWQAGRLPAELMEIVADEKRKGAIVVFLGVVGTVALILSIDWDKVQECLDSIDEC